MRYPQMILFDYGHTLLYDPDWNPARGDAELMKHVVRNPNNCTLQDVRKAGELIFGKHVESVRKMGYEICAQAANRTLYEYLGMTLSLTPLEMEVVFWDGASAGGIIPHTAEMLDYINAKGIRSAVISNMLWSGEALARRIHRLLPRNRFEFIMTSSDYFLRKPNRILFDIALQKAGICADEVWYCGDNPQADIEGAAQAGIYPVWYDNGTDRDYKDHSRERMPQCEHLHIHEWTEMVNLLEGMET